jgi:hypothetical protein
MNCDFLIELTWTTVLAYSSPHGLEVRDDRIRRDAG